MLRPMWVAVMFLAVGQATPGLAESQEPVEQARERATSMLIS